MHARLHLVVAPKIIETVLIKLKALNGHKPDDPDYLNKTQSILGYLNQITQIEPRSHLTALRIIDSIRAAQSEKSTPVSQMTKAFITTQLASELQFHSVLAPVQAVNGFGTLNTTSSLHIQAQKFNRYFKFVPTAYRTRKF
jgi:hypothetical protein